MGQKLTPAPRTPSLGPPTRARGSSQGDFLLPDTTTGYTPLSPPKTQTCRQGPFSPFLPTPSPMFQTYYYLVRGEKN